jgi:DMSO reductase family type II enzyme chaperone
MNAVIPQEAKLLANAESEALERAQIYHFFEMSLAHPGEDGHAFFIRESTSHVFILQFADVMHSGGEACTKGLIAANKFFSQIREMSFEDLEAAHISLFSNNYPHLPCPPYGSLFTAADGEKRLEEMHAIKAFYQQHGMDIADSFDDLPDHICVELEFMQVLCFREHEAAKNSDIQVKAIVRAAEAEFLSRFLIPFASRLADIASQSNPENPYSHLLEVVRHFTSHHYAEI